MDLLAASCLHHHHQFLHRQSISAESYVPENIGMPGVVLPETVVMFEIVL